MRPTSASNSDDIATRTRRKWGRRFGGESIVATLPRRFTGYFRHCRPASGHECCVKSSVASVLRSPHLNLFDCAAPRSFARTWGGKEACNDRDVERCDGPGELRDLYGPCFRRLSFASLKSGLRFSGPRVPGKTTHHLFSLKADSENFNQFGRASGVAGAPCVIMTSFPAVSSL